MPAFRRSLTPDQRRIRTICFAIPMLCGTTYVLVRRLFYGDEQRVLTYGSPIIDRPASSFKIRKRRDQTLQEHEAEDEAEEETAAPRRRLV